MGDSRTSWVNLKVTAAQRDEWHRLAELQGLSLSDLIRQRMGDPALAEPRRRARRADPALVAAVARVGNNLNQVAKWANAYGPRASVVEVLAVLAAIDRRLRALIEESDRGRD